MLDNGRRTRFANRLFMKRFLVGSALVMSLVTGMVFWHLDQTVIPAVRLAPADAQLFIECPNLARTAERWPATAVSHILKEPSVQRFFGCPLKALPRGYQLIWTHLLKLQPTSAFFCTTDLLRREWLIGLRCASNLRGWQADARTLAADSFGGEFSELYPDTVISKVPRPKDPGITTVYGIRCGSWLLFSPDPAAAKAAFERRTQARAGLETCETFQRCQRRVQASPDVVTFAQGPAAEMIERVLPGCDPEAKTQRALIATTSLDGTQVRDQVFTLGACGGHGTPPLSRKALEATSVGTLFYASTHMVPSAWRNLVHAAAEHSALAATFDDYFDGLAKAGIDICELDPLLSDLEIVLERDPVTDIFQPIFSVALRDIPRVRACMEKVVKSRLTSCASTAVIEQVPVFLLQTGTKDRPVTLALGIIDQQLVLAGSPACFAETVRRLRVHQVGLSRSERYQMAVNSVALASDAFAYLDTKPAFEKVYPTLRPMAILGSALVPTLTDYVDPSSLPDTSEISHYLTPIVFSRRHLPEGTIDESVGPITAYQAAIVGFGAGMTLGLVESPAN
jgi:hypothetical protein